MILIISIEQLTLTGNRLRERTNLSLLFFKLVTYRTYPSNIIVINKLENYQPKHLFEMRQHCSLKLPGCTTHIKKKE